MTNYHSDPIMSPIFFPDIYFPNVLVLILNTDMYHMSFFNGIRMPKTAASMWKVLRMVKHSFPQTPAKDCLSSLPNWKHLKTPFIVTFCRLVSGLSWWWGRESGSWFRGRAPPTDDLLYLQHLYSCLRPSPSWSKGCGRSSEQNSGILVLTSNSRI